MIFFGSSIPDIIVFGPVMEIVIYGRIVERPGCSIVSKYGHVDGDFTTTSTTDVFKKGTVSWMQVDHFISDELRSRYLPR